MLVFRRLSGRITMSFTTSLSIFHPSYKSYFSTIAHRNRYSFVNIPIDSKYYHNPLPDRIHQILSMIQTQSKLNEKTVLLEHLVDTIDSNRSLILTHNHRARVVKQLHLWKGRGGYKDKVATVAWVINKLYLYKQCQDLYLEIVDRFENDQWYPNLDESVKALEAFANMSNEKQKEYIYPRIEKNIGKCVWEQNLKLYQRIVMGLLLSGRIQSPLWDKLQNYIMRNLGMDYSLKTITDIFTAYALAQRGSDMFFQMIQKAIYLGHWYNYQLKHRILPGYDQKGEFYALLVETYSIVKRNTNIHLLPGFLDYIYSGVADRQTEYQNLSSFTRLIQHLPGLFEPEDQQQIITNLLEHKKPTSISHTQIIDFYHTAYNKQLTVPTKLQKHIQKQFINDVRRKLISPTAVIELTDQLLQFGYVLDEDVLLMAVDESLTSRVKYLEGEEAKEVLKLVNMSKYLPERTKSLLALPGRSKSDIF